jgi:hypothetical protein
VERSGTPSASEARKGATPGWWSAAEPGGGCALKKQYALKPNFLYLPEYKTEALENKFLDKFLQSFSLELPHRDTLNEYIELIVPEIRPWGEDLYEMEHFSEQGGKPWLEVSDRADFQEAVLHFFNEGGEYLRSINGNVGRGTWRLLERTNKIIIDLHSGGRPAVSEIYELIFLDDTFFILEKHGVQGRDINKRQFLVLGYEPYIKSLDWREYVEYLFNTYRSRSQKYRLMVLFLILVLAFIIVLSVW